ncbi:unnamed protein product [Gadus morhua 'NCC']
MNCWGQVAGGLSRPGARGRRLVVASRKLPGGPAVERVTWGAVVEGREQLYVLCKCQAGAAVKIQPGHGPRLGPEESSYRVDHTLPRPIGPGFLY